MTDEKAEQQTDMILGNREVPPQVETTPQTLLSQAIQQGLSIEHLRGLMDLEERYNANIAKNAFYKAFAQFQSLCPVLEKQGKVNYKTSTGKTEYSFSELGYIFETIKPILKECELTFRFEFDDVENGEMICWCIITHVLGHSERSKIRVGKDSSGGKNTIQSIGSARTYAQRYSLIAALGLTTADQDNDGETTEQQREEPKPKQEEKTGTIKEQFESCLNMVQLSNVWNGLTSKQKIEFAFIKDQQKEKIRLLSLSIPLTETSSIFEIEEKLNFIKTKAEADTFTRCNQKVLDELNDDNINKKFQSLLKTLA